MVIESVQKGLGGFGRVDSLFSRDSIGWFFGQQFAAIQVSSRGTASFRCKLPWEKSCQVDTSRSRSGDISSSFLPDRVGRHLLPALLRLLRAVHQLGGRFVKDSISRIGCAFGGDFGFFQNRSLYSQGGAYRSVTSFLHFRAMTAHSDQIRNYQAMFCVRSAWGECTVSISIAGSRRSWR